MAKKTAKKSSGGFDLESFLRKNKTKMKEAVIRAKDDEGGFPSYDDGRYKLKLIRMEAAKSQAGRPQVCTTYKFLDGDYKGKEYRAYRGIENEDNIFYFMQDVKRLGYDIDEFEPDEFADLLKQITKDKPVIMGVLKTKESKKDGQDYQNLLINRVIGDDEDEDDDDDEDDEDDEPKKKKKSKKSKKDDEDDDEDSDDEDSEDEDDEDEDEPKKKSKKKSSKKKKDDDEDDDDEDESDEDEDDDEDEKPKKKKKGKKSDDDDDEEEEEEDESDEDDEDESEEVPVTVGSIVKVKLKSGTQKCEVVDVLEDDNAIKVETKDGKTVKVSADKIISVEEPPKKKKKAKK